MIYLHEVKEETKLNRGDRNQNRGWVGQGWERLTGEEPGGTFMNYGHRFHRCTHETFCLSLSFVHLTYVSSAPMTC